MEIGLEDEGWVGGPSKWPRAHVRTRAAEKLLSHASHLYLEPSACNSSLRAGVDAGVNSAISHQ